MEDFGKFDFDVDVLKCMNIGRWVFEIDEGCAPRMYCGGVMRELLGIDDAWSPEQTYQIWYEGIESEYIEDVEAMVARTVAGEFGEVQYAWHHPTKGRVFVRCNGLRNKEYKDGIRLEGFHREIDIDVFMSAEKQSQEQMKTLNRQLVHSIKLQKLVGALSDEYYSVFGLNLETKQVDSYKQSGRMADMESNSFVKHSYEFAMDYFVEQAVQDEDRAMIRSELQIDTIRQNIMEKGVYKRIYRNEKGEYTEMKVVQTGADSVVVGFAVKDREIRQEMELQEQIDIIDQLSHEYISLWKMDTRTQRVQMLRDFSRTDTEHRALEDIRSAGSYSESLDVFVRKYVAEEDRARFLEKTSIPALMDTVPKGLVYPLDFRVQTVTGDIRYYQVLFVRTGGSDEYPVFSYAFRDVDALIRSEIQFRQALEQARDEAQAANEFKTTFLFNMSHDIRTPMNAIVGYTDMALRHDDDPQIVRDSLRRINESSQQLLNLINDILEMSRIESGKMELELEAASVRMAGNRLHSIFASQAQEKNIQLVVDAENLRHDRVLCDVKKIERIMMNLLSNAIKFTPDNGTICIRAEELDTGSDTGARYRFTVTDTGIGVSREFLERIFEPFERERTSTVSRQPGTGLGMAIVNNLVQFLGGTIDVQSDEAKGSSFSVEIPLVFANEQELASNPTLAPHHISFDGKTVLLVEDMMLNRELAMLLLEDMGLTVDTAENGVLAVEAFEAQPDRYDAILMDVQMPLMDGYTATKTIRAMDLPRAKTIPIIAMTANAFAEDKVMAIDAGMNEHVAKPIDTDRLNQVLSEFLG